MHRKTPKLTAEERAILDRMNRLSEKEVERLTTREIIAYFKIIDKLNPRAVCRALEEAAVDHGLTNADIRRMAELAKWKH
jgi:hypothetical protein